MGPLSTLLAGIVGFGIWLFLGLGIAAVLSDGTRYFWSTHWCQMVVGSIIVLTLLAETVRAEKKMEVQSEGRRRVVVAFIIVPFIAIVMMTVIAFGASRMALAMEIVFILVTALMPAAIYQLFLATRRPSILNEFLGNLSRLGLLMPDRYRRTILGQNADGARRNYESEEERRTRIESYFQRFEAIYGTLRFETEDLIALSCAEFVNRLILTIYPDPNGTAPQLDRPGDPLQCPRTQGRGQYR